MSKNVLITGGAGFIGSHLAELLVNEGINVTAIDNFDPFYDRSIKEDNISWLLKQERFELIEIDILDLAGMRNTLTKEYDAIVHVAAKAGVHSSVKDPISCQQVNVIGTQNMLELAKEKDIKQFIFASSSSVYGVNPDYPWKENDQKMLPISPYASSKVSCELLGHVYSQLYGIRFIGLRFFTVYGPRQRPDLAIYKFAQLILNGRPITRYGDGSTKRDYTFISDVVKVIRASIDYEKSNYEIINVGSNRTISLQEMIDTIGVVFNIEPIIEQLPMQPGDVEITYADISKARALFNYSPSISFRDGIEELYKWMRSKGEIKDE